MILFLKTRLWKLRFVRPKRCFASRSWFSCVPFDLLWSPGLTFPWDFTAGRCSRPGCGCHWDQEDLRVGHQHQAWRSLTTEGFEGRIWSILNQHRLGFSSRQHVFYQDHSRQPLGFLPFSNGWIWLLWQPFHSAEATGSRQQWSVDGQPLPPRETQRAFSTRNKLHVPFQKHKFHVPEELALHPAELMDIVTVRTKRPRGDHAGKGHGSFSHLLPPPHLFPVLSKLCYCWTTRMGTFPSLQQEPTKFAGFFDG